MHKYQREGYLPFNRETIADEALFSGRVDLAEIILHDALKTEPLHTVGYHHLRIKSISLPLYSLLFSPANSAEIDSTKEKINKNIADMINVELDPHNYYYPGGGIKSRQVGKLSEYVAFRCLNGSDNGEIVVPARQVDDMRNRIDFVGFTGGSDSHTSTYQTKTRSALPLIDGIRVISMNQLDPDFNGHHLDDSLARGIAREAAGIATSQDIDKLEQTRERLDKLKTTS